MNIIFVDIDGPLLSRKMHMFSENTDLRKGAMPRFDEFSIRAFNLWTKYSDAKIVFSTYWAFTNSADQLKEIMAYNGLEFEYHDDVITPKDSFSRRGDEIVDWLKAHPEVEKFIAVDDDISTIKVDDAVSDGIIKSVGRWVNVDFDNGLSWENYLDGCAGLGINIHRIDYEEFGIVTEDLSKHTFLW